MANGKRRISFRRWFGFRRQDDRPGEVETVRKETAEQATLDAEIGNRTAVRMENLADSEEPAVADDSQALSDAKQMLREQSIDYSGETLSDTADTASDDAEVRLQRDEPGVEQDEPSVETDTQYTAPTIQAQSGEPIRRVGDMASSLNDVDDTAMRKPEPEFQSPTLGEAAAAADIGDGVTGQPGIEEPIAEVAELPDVGTGDDLGIDDATGLAPPSAGEARGGIDLLGGFLTGEPGKSDDDLDFPGGADPRLADETSPPTNMTEDGNDKWSGSQEWTDVMSSKGTSETQSIVGKEHYETERYTLDVETTHEDGVTRQRITQTDKETGEVTQEETTEGPSGEDDTADAVGPVSGDDSTPDPVDGDDGGIGDQTEAFRNFTDTQRIVSTPDILGAESLQQQQVDGERSSTPYERPPREISEEMLKSQLDPYIQYADDHVDTPQLAPEDYEFDNTLVDPDLDPIGGLSGLKGFPGETGPDPEADAIDELDLDG